MKIHLLDGTYELFRAYFGAPKSQDPGGREVGAVRGLLRSLAMLLRDPEVSHVGCAFDHVIESFRNELYAGYKTSAGVPEELLAQFELAEEACRALGIVTWPMVDLEADDAIATAAARFSKMPEVRKVVLCTPDKDLAQCVEGERVVLWDRKQKLILDEAAVREKFGVSPTSIPDFLGLVGDAADGIPGLPRWGAKTTALVLGRYPKIEEIPSDPSRWEVAVRGASALSAILEGRREEALLYRQLATLRLDAELADCTLEGLAWRGARRDQLEALTSRLGERNLVARIERWQAS